MEMGHDDGAHVADGATGLGQPGVQGIPGIVGGPPGIDQGDSVVQFEHVDRDVAQGVVRDGDGNRPQAGSDFLHGGHHVAVPCFLLRGAGDSKHSGHGNRAPCPKAKAGAFTYRPSWQFRPGSGGPLVGLPGRESVLLGGTYFGSRPVRRTVTVSPSPLPILFRTSDLIGNLWVPSPRAMKELWIGRPPSLALSPGPWSQSTRRILS